MSTAIAEPASIIDRAPDNAPDPIWVEAVPLSRLETEGRALVKRAGKQIALFSTRGGVRAIANRCPHEGYPLSEGTLAEGAPNQPPCTLTCNWHNWKFDLDSGEVVGGGDAVRTYPVEVRDGMVWVDVVDPPARVRIDKALASLKAGFRRYEYDRMTRDLARIEAAGGDLAEAVCGAIGWTHDRFEWGMTHAYAALADWLTIAAETADEDDRLVAHAEILGHLVWDSLREDRYPFADGAEPWEEDRFVTAIEAEDETTAVRLFRGGLASGGFVAVDRGLCRAALAHYQDFGHSAIYVEKVREAVERLGDEVAEPMGLALVRSLVNARREDLIPEFKAYRPARETWTGRGRELPKPADFCRVSVAKCLDRAVTASGDPERLYDALLQAAAWQLLYADPLYASRAKQPVSQNVGRLDFSHAITFANAGRRMVGRYPELWPDVLLQMACFLGRNGGFVDPAYPAERWRVADEQAFLAETAANIVDHGNPEYIVSAHLVKMTCAVREEVTANPTAAWGPDLVAALNRFLNEPFKRKLTRRTAHQARKTIEGE